MKCIYLFSPINRKSVNNIIFKLDNSSISKIILSSNGGNVDEAIKLYEHIRVLNRPIDIQVRGTAQSCATIILASATGLKEMTKNSYLMYHNSYLDVNEKINISKSKERYLEMKFIENIISSLYDNDFYLKYVKDKEVYLNATDALKLKLIDKIV